MARDAAGERMGFLSFYDVRDRRAGPLRLVLRKSRAIPVTVLDGKGQPLAGVKVHADFYLFTPRVAPREIIEQSTDAQGKALLRVPSDMPLASVFAVKAGAGFDYVIYRRGEGQRRARIPRPAAIDPLQRAPDDSRPINFVLSGVHKVRVHVVDGRRRPLPGIHVQTNALARPNRGGQAFFTEFRTWKSPPIKSGTRRIEYDSGRRHDADSLEHAHHGSISLRGTDIQPG